MDQNNLMDVYLDRLFKKYNVSPEKTDLNPEQREKIKNIVQNIQTDVTKFLENTEKSVTERDMPKEVQQSTPAAETDAEQNVVEEYTNMKSEAPKTKPKVFVKGNRRRRR